MTLYELIERVENEEEDTNKPLNIVFVSNIILEPYMELYLRLYFMKINYKVNYNFIKTEDVNNADYKFFEATDLVIVNINFEYIANYQQRLFFDEYIEKKLYKYIKKLIFQIEKQVTRGEVIIFALEDYFSPYTQITGKICNLNNNIDTLNYRLKKLCSEKDWVLLATKSILAEVGTGKAYDNKNRLRWDCVYSELVIERFAYEIYKQYKIQRQMSKKCIILDCDNVLWGGYLSEVGIDGIQLGNHGMGMNYKIFQTFIKELYNMGIVLALCSKNDLLDVNTVFREHKEMVLRQEYISYYAVGWENKTKGIIEISKYLNLSLESMIFIDDNITEIKEVQTILPEVESILFDVWNPFKGFCDFINLSGKIDEKAVEFRRTTYQTNALREKQKENLKDYSNYLKLLDTKVDIHVSVSNELERISTLLLRANKCSNGKRYSKKELKSLFDDNNYEIYAVYAQDYFSELGLVGTMIVYNKMHLDAFCLSCRVLGRNLEHEMFKFIISRYAIVSYDFISTGKNVDVEKLCNKYI